jgi:pyruvate/2-oxoglutarate/acetoin dehydrogenase E1 component
MQTGRMLVVDEDYRGFGLSGELAAVVMEAGVSAAYAGILRVSATRTATSASREKRKACQNPGAAVRPSKVKRDKDSDTPAANICLLSALLTA